MILFFIFKLDRNGTILYRVFYNLHLILWVFLDLSTLTRVGLV